MSDEATQRQVENDGVAFRDDLFGASQDGAFVHWHGILSTLHLSFTVALQRFADAPGGDVSAYERALRAIAEAAEALGGLRPTNDGSLESLVHAVDDARLRVEEATGA